MNCKGSSLFEAHRHQHIANFIGDSLAFQQTLRVIQRMAQFDAAVLIQGETGTGKELAARAIHYLGRRRDYPFVPVNCGAIPDNLVENEFFGHVKGAFTDAKETRLGLVANAKGGTLLLDEIECLSPKGQVVLLRFLQDQIYRPVGAAQQLHADVRIIAASNRDLVELVGRGEFRPDLLYRLAIVSLSMPALRDRGEDVILLANYFVRRFARAYGEAEKTLDPDSLQVLARHHWPGNIRELENLIHREFLMTDGPTLLIRVPALTVGSAPVAEPSMSPLARMPIELGFRRAKAIVIAEFEKAFLSRALAQSSGNVSLAARMTGKERRAFSKLLKKHGIERSPYQVESKNV